MRTVEKLLLSALSYELELHISMQNPSKRLIVVVGRTYNEKLSDQFLLSYLVHDAFKHIRILPRTKLQKLVFLSEWSMIQGWKKGFNYAFIKLIYGPFSQELENDLTSQIRQGNIKNLGLRPTERLDLLVEDFGELLTRNRSFIEIIQKTNRKYARVPLKVLLKTVYGLPHPYLPGRTIAELNLRTPILYRMKEDRAKETFRITDSEAEDLEASLDPKIFSSLVSAMDDIKHGRLVAHNEVF